MSIFLTFIYNGAWLIFELDKSNPRMERTMPDPINQKIALAMTRQGDAIDEFIKRNDATFHDLVNRVEAVEAKDSSPGPADVKHDSAEVFNNFADQLRGKAMSIGSDPSGGALVPSQIDSRILDQLVEISPIRRIADVVQTTSSDYTKIVNKRGAASSWGNENTTRTATDTPILAEIRPPSGELWAYPTVTSWLLDDATFNVEKFINENVATEFAFQEGTAFVTGDGVDKPRGFTTYDTAATADDSRDFGTIEHVAAASATVVTAAELVDLVYSLAPAYRQGPGVAWVFNTTTAAEIRKLTGDDARFLWTDGLVPGQPPNLLGFPVVEAEDMPDTASGLLAIAFANWPRAYIITDRTGTRMIRDDVTTPGKVKFSFGKRVGGAVTDSNAIKFLKMN